jgi:hypothetical protein
MLTTLDVQHDSEKTKWPLHPLAKNMQNNGQPFASWLLCSVHLAFISGTNGVKLILLYKLDSSKKQITSPSTVQRTSKKHGNGIICNTVNNGRHWSILPTVYTRLPQLPFVSAFKTTPLWKALKQICTYSTWNVSLAFRDKTWLYCQMDSVTKQWDKCLNRHKNHVKYIYVTHLLYNIIKRPLSLLTKNCYRSSNDLQD